MLSINTNLSSLIAQHSMKSATQLLNQAVERMTTGYKINHAKDNAANYSIATNLTTKINSYMVAEENCAMGLDLLATANGSLDQISDKLTRLRDLATQASNGTYGQQSLNAINAEANALVDEINRLYSTAEYNGKKLLEVDLPIPDGYGVQRTGNYGDFISDPKTYTDAEVASMTRVKDVSTFTSGQKYAIYSKEELQKLADYVNAGNDTTDVEFVLGADIDLSSISNWTPIGNSTNAFKGTFDGNGHVIKNITINNSTESQQGFFGYVSGITVKNLGLVNIYVKGNNYVGSVGGYLTNGSSLQNCYATGIIKGDSTVGGLVGELGNQANAVKDCYAECDIVATGNTVGGLVGSHFGTNITNCYATGDVTGQDDVGGLCGYNEGGGFNNCYSTGNVNGNNNVAGLVAEGSVGEYSYSTGDIRGKNCVGGASATMSCSNVCSFGNIYGEKYVGGVTGQLSYASTVSNVASYGTVNGNEYVGSIVGAFVAEQDSEEFGYSTYTLTMTNCKAYDQGVSPVGVALKRNYPMTGQSTYEISTNFSASDYDDLVAYIASPKNVVTLQIGINSSDNSQISTKLGIDLSKISSLRGIGVESKDYILLLDNMLTEINTVQTNLGAVENRLTSALDEISIQYENLVSSRSTIRDADIAEVSSEYIRQQILQQASATLMATANQSPAIALQLI